MDRKLGRSVVGALMPVRCPSSTLQPTLVAQVELLARLRPEQVVFRFLVDGEARELGVSREQLLARARAVAAHLEERGIEPGERASLLYAAGLDYIVALLGCMIAGVVAVPALPPDPRRLDRTVARLRSIFVDARVRAVLGTKEIAELAAGAIAELGLGPIELVATDHLEPHDGRCAPRFVPKPETIAMLQYTSGSTSSPKGVVLEHRHIMANEATILAKSRPSADEVLVSWLPPQHDMGLFGGIVYPLVGGLSGVLMDPLEFLARPVRWLSAISRYRGTQSPAPNFAYELCLNKIADAELDDLDLSSWRIAWNGAEPIDPATIRAFAERFSSCGLSPRTMYPCYGLAEATLLAAGGDPDVEPIVRRFDAAALDADRAIVAGPRSRARELVSCGTAATDGVIAIVDPDTATPRADAEVGEIWIAGPSVAAGYFDRPELSRACFEARLEGAASDRPFLRTGDLGFIHDGELFVTGRLKELIIVRGRNIHPRDVERVVDSCHLAIARGGVAAFEDDGGIAVVAECRVADGLAEVGEAIRRAVVEAVGVAPRRVVLIRPHAMLKTTSGKLRRRALGPALSSGQLVPTWVWVATVAVTVTAAAGRLPTPTPTPTDGADLLVFLAGYLARFGIAESIEPSVAIDSLGLDSLQKVELLDALRDHGAAELPLHAFARCETIGDLLGVLAGRRVDVEPSAAEPTRPRGPSVLALAPGDARVVPAPSWLDPRPLAPTLEDPILADDLPRGPPLSLGAGEAGVALTEIVPAFMSAPLPQAHALDYTAWLIATSRCLAHDVRSEVRARAIFDETHRELARYGVDASAIASRRLLTMPDALATARPERLDPLLPLGFEELASQPAGAGIERRMRIFAEVADAALAQLYAADEPPPDDLIHVTCSGYLAPSPVERFVAARGWPTTVTHAYHMGCYAAFPAVRMAAGVLGNSRGGLSRQKSRVDVVHTELLSNHASYAAEDPGDLVTLTLFADGFIRYRVEPAALARAEGRRGLLIHTLDERLLPACADAMTWDLGAHAFEMFLSRDVPLFIHDHVRGLVDAILAPRGLEFDAIRDRLVYALHPGGPRVVELIRRKLGLRPEQVQRSLDVLRRHGNMSSATVAHIWAEIVADDRLPPGTGVLSLAFGPGLTATGLLLEKL